MKKKYKDYLFIIVISIIVCIPLFNSKLDMFRDDGVQHIARLMGTVQSVTEGQTFSVIMSNFCNGFGYSRNIFYSPLTAYIPLLLKIFVTSYKKGGYKFTVNCRNQAEVDKMNLLTKEWNAEIQVKSVEPFFCLYLHDIMSIIDNDYDVKGKSIYLYNYSKNHPNDEMTDMTAIHPIALRWKNTTDFSFISPYINFQMPVG